MSRRSCAPSPAPVRDQRFEFDISRSLDPQRILRTVTFRRIIGAIEQRVDGLLPSLSMIRKVCPASTRATKPFRRNVVSVYGIGAVRNR